MLNYCSACTLHCYHNHIRVGTLTMCKKNLENLHIYSGGHAKTLKNPSKESSSSLSHSIDRLNSFPRGVSFTVPSSGVHT